jgi:hypothetical protein
VLASHVPTHSERHSGSLLSRGLSPPRSACRLVADRSLLAVGVCTTHRVSPAAMAPILDFEVFFHTEMLGSFAVLPAAGSRSPLQVSSSSRTRVSTLVNSSRSRRTPSTRGVGSQSLDSAETKSSLWSPRLQRLTGEKVWRPSPGLAALLEVSSL